MRRTLGGVVVATVLSVESCGFGTTTVVASDGSSHEGPNTYLDEGHRHYTAIWREALIASAMADLPCDRASIAVADSFSLPFADEDGDPQPGRASLDGCGWRVSYDLVGEPRQPRHGSRHCVLTGRVRLTH